MLDREHRLPLVRQCELLGVARSTFYHRPRAEGAADLDLMRQLDEIHLRLPFLGSRRMVDELDRGGLRVNRKRVRRLMRLMGIRALYPRKRTSQPQPGHRVFPYLLRELKIVRPNQVWASDITYIPMAHGFMYLVAVMDWFSRRVLAWEVSNSLEADFCVEAGHPVQAFRFDLAGLRLEGTPQPFVRLQVEIHRSFLSHPARYRFTEGCRNLSSRATGTRPTVRAGAEAGI